VFTCGGWQVILCDPIWQLTPRSCEMEFLKSPIRLLTLTLDRFAAGNRSGDTSNAYLFKVYFDARSTLFLFLLFLCFSTVSKTFSVSYYRVCSALFIWA